MRVCGRVTDFDVFASDESDQIDCLHTLSVEWAQPTGAGAGATNLECTPAASPRPPGVPRMHTPAHHVTMLVCVPLWPRVCVREQPRTARIARRYRAQGCPGRRPGRCCVPALAAWTTRAGAPTEQVWRRGTCSGRGWTPTSPTPRSKPWCGARRVRAGVGGLLSRGALVLTLAALP